MSDFDIDFDQWMKLWEEDPEEFIRRKEALVTAAIDGMDTDEEHKQRLKAMQWRLEQDLNKAGADRYNQMVRKFWAQVDWFIESTRDI